jgi:hypothetical protein
VEPVLELGPVEGEEDVEDVLRRVRVADREVCLDEVEPGSGAVALRVVARCDKLDDLGDVAGRSRSPALASTSS